MNHANERNRTAASQTRSIARPTSKVNKIMTASVPARRSSFKWGCQQRSIARPIVTGAGIGLAAGRDVAVADDMREVDGGITLHERARNRGERDVLCFVVGLVVVFFVFVVVGFVFVLFVFGVVCLSRMPGAMIEGDVLHHFVVAVFF